MGGGDLISGERLGIIKKQRHLHGFSCQRSSRDQFHDVVGVLGVEACRQQQRAEKQEAVKQCGEPVHRAIASFPPTHRAGFIVQTIGDKFEGRVPS